MDAEIVNAFELVLVLGAVLAIGGYQVWAVRRARAGDARGETGRDRSDWSD